MKNNITAETGTRIAMWLGILGMIAGVAILFLFPKPTVQSVLTAKKHRETDIKIKAEQASKDFATAKTKVDAQTWTGNAEEVGPGSLAAMNTLATKYKVKLSGFRPERTSQAGGLDLLPYSVTATGGFMDVLNFAKAIENPTNKLAVDSLQIASSEASSDQVIANIGLTAYRVSEETKHA